MARLSSFLEEWHDARDYVCAHTSGSTGVPKEIRLLKADMRASAEATNAFFGINLESVLALPLSEGYIAGKMMAVRADISGARLLELPVSNRICLTERVDLLAVVPSQLDSLISEPCPQLVGNLLIGGGAPDAAKCAALVRLGYRVYISYGMTETCSHVALARGDDPDRVFHAMPGISFENLPDGRLAIRCPRYSFGYLETNDLAEVLTPVSFRWRGRADGVINSGGIKYVPEELEREYAPALEGVRYYVSSVKDARWGQAVALVAEMPEADRADVMRRLESVVGDRRRLPKHIFAVESLPEASNGKIRRLPPDELKNKRD